MASRACASPLVHTEIPGPWRKLRPKDLDSNQLQQHLMQQKNLVRTLAMCLALVKTGQFTNTSNSHHTILAYGKLVWQRDAKLNPGLERSLERLRSFSRPRHKENR